MRAGFLALAAGLALCLASGPAAAAGPESLEYAVKAAYLYKFAPFVEWPGTAFQSPSSALVLCVVGDDPFHGLLEQVVSGQRSGGRPIVVRHLRTVTRDSGCQIMYASGSEAQSVAEILAAVHGTPVLTVTDAARPGRATGIINFVVRDNHVRFEIDNQAASENGLAISSKLLSLAVYVRPKV